MRLKKLKAINGWMLIQNDYNDGSDKYDQIGNPIFRLDNIKLLTDVPTDGDIEKAIRDELICSYGESNDEIGTEYFEEDLKDFTAHAKICGNKLAVIGSYEDYLDVMGTEEDFIRWGLTIDRNNVILTMTEGEGDVRTAKDQYGNTYQLEIGPTGNWTTFDVEQIDGYWDMDNILDEGDVRDLIIQSNS